MTSIIDRLAENFSKFPGIGPRQAKRFVYHLLQQDSAYLGTLSQNILRLKKEINRCSKCFRYYPPIENYDELCELCRSNNRTKEMLMVVAKDTDIDSVEKSHAYDGLYFVLGGLIPLTENSPDQSIREKELLKRLEPVNGESKISEIIIAMPANTEGDHTTEYFENLLKNVYVQKNIKISKLGRGMSTGTELEYSDTSTITSALKNRT
ncbi:MAG: recombination protein RecR [Candidatus Vogelbacteria bacterium]|nr:recombination protein RecR [Candidatus Vogelbacteria bacterium]